MRIPITDRRSATSRADRPPEPAPIPAAAPPLAALDSPPPGDEEADEPLRAERDAWKDRCLRTAAELENLRKSLPRRVDEEVFRRERESLVPWLEIGDAIDRALDQLREAPAQWRTGLTGVAGLFEEQMSRCGARPIPTDVLFDPALHEAVAVVPAGGRADGSIVDVLRRGWTLGERLLRPAGVVVARGAR